VQIGLTLIAVSDLPLRVNRPKRDSSWKNKFTELKSPTALNAIS
jgi:hypothetical protein